jgi:two-component system, OmpR family, sensor histidine kinase TctE
MTGQPPVASASYSLRRRLLLWLFLASAALGLIALADTWREALRTSQTVSDRVLFGSALAIAERVSLDESGVLEVDLPYSSLEMLTSTAQDRVFYRIDGPSGAFVSGYPDLPILAPPVGAAAFADGRYGDVAIRTVTLSREISTGDRALIFRVAVAESTRARQALAMSILLRAGLRLGVMAAVVAAVVWAAVTVALRPLGVLGGVIAQRSPADLRPVTLTAPQEVGALLGAVNGFMARLDTALGALRNFTGNASHQLRTPLSVVRTQLALLERSLDPIAARAALGAANDALTRAERVLAQLLVLARVDAAQSAAAIKPIDVAKAARTITAEMVPAMLQAGIDLGYDGPDHAMALAEPVLLGELLKNLLDNARAYAGRGAIVTVRLSALQGAAVLLEVEDNGPGLDHSKTAALMADRGHSLRLRMQSAAGGDGAKTGGQGYGLGLAITAEIAALFGAHLSLQRGEGGAGLCAQVQFSGPDSLTARPNAAVGGHA